MRGEPNRTHLVTALELAVALLTTFLTATLLAKRATWLSALPLPEVGAWSIALTARSLLTSTWLSAILLTFTLIFFTIVCHDFSLPCSKC
jgi:hypothetical protein